MATSNVNNQDGASNSKSELVDALKDQVTCTTCLGLPINNVFQCGNGHLLCDHCLDQLEVKARKGHEALKCPTCQEKLPTDRQKMTRGRLAESILKLLPRPCPHEGCQVEMEEGPLRADHIAGCKWKPMACVKLDCKTPVPSCQLLNHYKSEHLYLVNFNNFEGTLSLTTRNFDMESTWNETHLMVSGENFFSCCRRDSAGKWFIWIRMVGTKEEAADFSADIAVFKPSSGAKLVFSGHVDPLPTPERQLEPLPLTALKFDDADALHFAEKVGKDKHELHYSVTIKDCRIIREVESNRNTLNEHTLTWLMESAAGSNVLAASIQQQSQQAQPTPQAKVAENAPLTQVEASPDANEFTKASFKEVQQEAVKWANACSYMCKLCGYQVLKYYSMRTHMMKNHRLKIAEYERQHGPVRTETIHHKCLVCDSRLIHDAFSIDIHTEAHHSLTLVNYFIQYVMAALLEKANNPFGDRKASNTGAKRKLEAKAGKEGKKQKAQDESAHLHVDLTTIPSPPAKIYTVKKAAPVPQELPQGEGNNSDEGQELQENELAVGKKEKDEVLQWANQCLYSCKLCSMKTNSYFPFTNHLKRVHNIQAKDYKQRHGDMRYQFKVHTCLICQREVHHDACVLRKHVSGCHDLTLPQYYMKYCGGR